MKNGFFLCLCALWFTGAKAQQIDVQHYDIDLTLNDTTNRIEGRVTIAVKYLQNTTRLKIDLAGMNVSGVHADNKLLDYEQDLNALYIKVNARAGEKGAYTVIYSGTPKDGLFISKNKYGDRTFFTDHWPDRAHQWLPCIDHPSDKATVTFTVTAPDHYTVVANGVRVSETNLPGQLKRTVYDEKVPLPIKVMAIAAADFSVTHSGDVGKIPVYSYVFHEDSSHQGYARATNILPYFIQQVGPFQFEKLANIQSKTIFGGMENAGAIFYAEKSPEYPGLESLLAHEIAHQWFGDAITETDWRHLWLSEGFATYMTLLYMEHTYGVDTLRASLKEDKANIIEFAKKRKTPVVDTTVHSNYMQLLNENSYERGGWVLHMLRRKLGDELFWKGIRQYFKDFNGRNADTDDFRKEMEKISGQDLKGFFTQWLYTTAIPKLQVNMSYNENIHAVKLEVIQQQTPLFEFPLEYTLDKSKPVQTILVKDKVTTVIIPAVTKPAGIWLDPDTNLLADMSF
ncbi:M1 family metallopeptidase [Chitinophaga sancti]|uniref:M1 family metallopeptidase n=1 Tax=Chitinophaga sancti TaxID=1004 RepID=UPI002A74C8D3|nr:M1 family metallopeptidase [Chitinophaga sancti]WPQ61376.1 M1 family metallopeptidase [Chitinophaga sancti]